MTDFRIENPAAGGVSIGSTITSGTAGSVLFIGPTGLLAQDNPAFTYSSTSGLFIYKSYDDGAILYVQNDSAVVDSSAIYAQGGYAGVISGSPNSFAFKATIGETATSRAFYANISSTSLGYGLYIQGTLTSNYIRGKLGLNTTAPDKQLEINLGTSEAVRLSYNDSNGSAGVYGDITLSEVGALTFDLVGSTPVTIFKDAIAFEAEEAPNFSVTPISWFKRETLLSSGAVSSWTDSGSSGNNAVQATGSRQPIAVAGQYLTFDNTDVLVSPLNFTGKTAVTMFVVARAAAADVSGTFHWMTQLGPGIDVGTALGMLRFYGRYFATTQVPSSSQTALFNETDWHVYGARISATRRDFSIDGVWQTEDYRDSPPTVPGAIAFTTPLTIGAQDTAASFPHIGDIAEVVVYDSALSDDVWGAVGRGLVRKHALPTRPQLAMVGDSIFVGYGNTTYTPNQLAGDLFANSRTVNSYSDIGKTSTALLAEFDTKVAPHLHDVNGQNPILILEIGINDYISSVAAATTYANIVAIATKARKLGCTVYIVTSTPSQYTGAQETIRLAQIALIMANAATICDGIIPMGTHPIVGQQATVAADTTYTYFQNDGLGRVHWANATVQIFQGLLRSLISNSFTAAPGTTGSVVFIDSTGLMTQDNPNFFWDDTNNRLGIGTITPGSVLDIQSPAHGNVRVLTLGVPSSVGDNSQINFTIANTIDVARIQTEYASSNVGISFYTYNSGLSEKVRIDASGNLGIGITVPTGRIHLAAGTTAASTAPIKLETGSLMTSPEYGAVEFLTDKAYLTITTATPARKEFTLNDAALTSGRVPFCTTNGRLTSDSGFLYAAPLLTIGRAGAAGTLKLVNASNAGPTLSSGGTNYNLVFPNGAGTAGQAFLSNAGGTCTWGNLLSITGSFAVGDIISANTTTTISAIAAVATGQVFISKGTSTLPAWSTDLPLTGKITTYNNILTDGEGVTSIRDYTRPAPAQTAAVASVATYTLPATDGSFLVSANVLLTTASTCNFTVTVAYTDEGNTARTVTMQFSTLAGAFVTAITNVGGNVPYEGVPLHLRCKASTAITIATTGTFVGVQYNVEGCIRQIA